MSSGTKGPDKWRGPSGARHSHASVGVPHNRPSSRQSGSRRRRLLMSFAVFLIFIGVIIGLTFRFNSPVQPYVLSVAISEAADPNWPVALWGRQDSQRFKDLVVDAVLPFQEQNVAAIPNKLIESANDARTKKRPLLVHILAQVLLTGRGAELVASDSRTNDPERRLLPLVEILETLHNQRLPCLLLLDLRTIDIPWQGGLGELDHDEVLANLKKFYDQNEKTEVVTLCFCHAGSPVTVPIELECSVFAFALHEAFSGAANGWNDRGVHDIRITTEEVTHYVKARIHQWNELLGLPQNVPTLFGSHHFVIRTAKEATSEFQELPERQPYPEKLKLAWQKRDKALTGQINVQAPLWFRRWEAALVRTEQRWLGGNQQSSESDRIWGDLAQEEIRFNRALAPSPQPSHLGGEGRVRGGVSLTRQPIVITPEQSKLLKPIDALLLKLSQSQELKPDEWNAALAEATPLFDANKPALAQKLYDLVYGWTAVQPAQLRRIKSLLEAAKNPDFGELHLLRYLAGLGESQMQAWQTSFPALLRLEAAWERAIPEDARALPFLRDLCNKYDQEYNVILHSIPDGDLNREQRGKVAAALEPLVARFGALEEIGQALSSAFRERDACVALLPPLAFYNPPRADASAVLQRQWDQLISQLELLLRQLETKNQIDLAGAADFKSLSERVRLTRFALTETLATVPRNTPSFVLQTTLACPTLPLSVRQERYLTTSEQTLTWAKQRLVASDFASMRTSFGSTLHNSADPFANLQKVSRALDLLKLARHPAYQDCAQAWQEARTGQNPQSWQKLRQKLANIWINPPTQLELSRRVWYLSPFSEDADKDPMYQDRLTAEGQLLDWVANRYEQLAQSIDKINFNVARSYRDLAGKVRLPTP